MTEEIKQKNITDQRGDSTRGGRPPRGGRPSRGGAPRPERVKPEFDQKMISIRRVTRVVSGGRRFSFSVAILIGDRRGSFGIGTGKANDTTLAIEKAVKDAKKNMLTIKLTKAMSIPHEVSAKFKSSKIHVRPNNGKGLVAGSSIRDLLTLAGVQNVTAKIHSGSKNPLNNARACAKAFEEMSTPYTKKEVVAQSLPVNQEEK